MNSPDGTFLVLGVGNVLLRDEGVGVRVARDVAALGPGAVPAGTEVVDGGTRGLDLLPLVADAAAMVIVDAVNLRAEPGTVRVLRDAQLHAALAQHGSPHQVGIGDLVAAARLARSLPVRLSLVAIQPERIETGLELTAAVVAAVPSAVQAVLRELEAFAATLATGPDEGPGAVAEAR